MAGPKSVKSASQTNGFELRSKHYLILLVVVWAVFFSRVLLGIASLWEDAILLEYPHRVFARDSFLRFEFPHWNPFTFSGIPFFAGLLPGVLYPFNVALSFIPAGPSAFWYLLQLVIVGHCLLAGIGMYFYVVRHGLSRESAFTAAVAFMFSGFFVGHLIHPMMLYLTAWVPILALLIERSIRRGRFEYAVLAGVVLGVTTYAGHPQIMAYEFLFLGAYALYVWLSLDKKTFTRLLYPAAMFGVAIGLSAVQVLPAVELTQHSVRSEWSFEAASEGSLSFRQLFAVLLPKVFGAWTGARAGLGSDIPPFWLQDAPKSGYYTFWETVFYSGAVVFILAAAVFREIRRNGFVLFSALWLFFSLGMALGNNFIVYRILYEVVPGFKGFRIPARILFSWGFILPVLAAMTIDRITRRRDDAARTTVWVACVCLGVGALVGFGALGVIFPEMQEGKQASYAATQGWILAGLSGATLLLLWSSAKGALAPRFLKTGLILLVIIDMYQFGIGMHTVKGSGAPQFFAQVCKGPQANQCRFMKNLTRDLKRDSQDDVFRSNMRQYVLAPDTRIDRKSGLMLLKRNQGMIDQIQLVDGYNPLNLRRRLPPVTGEEFDMYLDLFNVKYYVTPAPTAGQPEILLNEDRFPRAKMFYRAKIMSDDSALAKTMREGAFDYRTTLLLTESPEISLPDDTTISAEVDIEEYRPNTIRVKVNTPKNGLLFLSEIWYPAWKAFVDGEQVKTHVANYSFRAIEVPAGVHTVTFEYRSTYFRIGLLISLITMIGAVTIFWLAGRRRSREQNVE